MPTQARTIRRFARDVSLKEDQAAGFYRAVCKQMRIESPYTDIGPGFSNFSEGSMPYLLGEFLYSSYANSFETVVPTPNNPCGH